MTTNVPVTAAYMPRRFAIGKPLRYKGWRIKRYYVLRDWGDRVQRTAFSAAERLSRRELPTPARAAGRAGAAFTIAHQGQTMCYFVLGWWDNENELPLRLWVGRRDEPGVWRSARGGEGLCVWDLDIVWFERRMYVRHVMTDPKNANVRDYLRAAHARAIPLKAMLARGHGHR